MARIRTIKPDFWTDARIGECSPTARLLFVASWNFSDDHGGLDRSAKQLKAQAFPYDNIDCEPLIQELLLQGLFIEYQVSGRKYLHIKGFKKHQRVEKPANPRIPLYDESTNSPIPVADHSPNGSGMVTVSSSSLGREGNGMEGIKSKSAARKPRARREEPEWFAEFRSIYPPRSGDQRWRDALRNAQGLIAAGHSESELLAGARRYAAWIAATKKAGTEYVKQAASFLGEEESVFLPWHLPTEPETASEEIRRLNGGKRNGSGRVFEGAEPGRAVVESPIWPVRG